MEIAVIGGGSLGLMWSARLIKVGIKPLLIVRTEEQKEIIGQRGVTYTENGVQMQLHPQVESIQSYNRTLPKYIIIAVKQTHLVGLLPFLQQHKNEDGYIFTLQNGLGHYDLLSSIFCPEQIILGTTSDGAYRHNLSHVERTGYGNVSFGQQGVEKVPPIVGELIDTLGANGWVIVWDAQILQRLWRKCIINCAINPLTAILNIENGKLPQLQSTLTMMRAIYEECIKVANLNKFQFNEDLWQEILDVCRNTSRNRSSMLQDIFRGNRTEIQFINGFMVQHAKTAGIDAPINQSLVMLVHAKEEINEE